MEELFSGVLIVDKDEGMTSHDVVNRIRRLFGTKQVGHTGTLDPMATGVLPVLVGRAVKAGEYLLAEDKSYEATLKLGLTTDTEDTTGRILSRCGELPDKETVIGICRQFVGQIEQVPPMFSALKRNGRKLVDLARSGVTVEREARTVTVRELTLSTENEREGLYRLRVVCTKGTYIRSLCRDIGEKLGCGGTMASLRRTASGRFTIENAHTLAKLESLSTKERIALLLPPEELFADLPALSLPPFYRRLASSGCPIYLKKIGASLPMDQLVRLYDGDRFFALGKVGTYEEGDAVKAVKQFILYDKDNEPCSS